MTPSPRRDRPQAPPPLTNCDPRSVLRPYEAALILQLSERQVIERIKGGKLSDISASRWARLDPAEVLDEANRLVEADLLSPLVLWIWRDVVDGRAHVTKPRSSNARPPAPLDFLCGMRNAQ